MAQVEPEPHVPAGLEPQGPGDRNRGDRGPQDPAPAMRLPANPLRINGGQHIMVRAVMFVALQFFLWNYSLVLSVFVQGAFALFVLQHLCTLTSALLYLLLGASVGQARDSFFDFPERVSFRVGLMILVSILSLPTMWAWFSSTPQQDVTGEDLAFSLNGLVEEIATGSASSPFPPSQDMMSSNRNVTSTEHISGVSDQLHPDAAAAADGGTTASNATGTAAMMTRRPVVVQYIPMEGTEPSSRITSTSFPEATSADSGSSGDQRDTSAGRTRSSGLGLEKEGLEARLTLFALSISYAECVALFCVLFLAQHILQKRLGNWSMCSTLSRVRFVLVFGFYFLLVTLCVGYWASSDYDLLIPTEAIVVPMVDDLSEKMTSTTGSHKASTNISNSTTTIPAAGGRTGTSSSSVKNGTGSNETNDEEGRLFRSRQLPPLLKAFLVPSLHKLTLGAMFHLESMYLWFQAAAMAGKLVLALVGTFLHRLSEARGRLRRERANGGGGDETAGSTGYGYTFDPHSVGCQWIDSAAAVLTMVGALHTMTHINLAPLKIRMPIQLQLYAPIYIMTAFLTVDELLRTRRLTHFFPTVFQKGFCVICMEELPEEEESKRLPCGHIFHSGCLLKWIRTSQRCPICRHPVFAAGPPPGRGVRRPEGAAVAAGGVLNEDIDDLDEDARRHFLAVALEVPAWMVPDGAVQQQQQPAARQQQRIVRRAPVPQAGNVEAADLRHPQRHRHQGIQTTNQHNQSTQTSPLVLRPQQQMPARATSVPPIRASSDVSESSAPHRLPSVEPAPAGQGTSRGGAAVGQPSSYGRESLGRSTHEVEASEIPPVQPQPQQQVQIAESERAEAEGMTPANGNNESGSARKRSRGQTTASPDEVNSSGSNNKDFRSRSSSSRSNRQHENDLLLPLGSHAPSDQGIIILTDEEPGQQAANCPYCDHPEASPRRKQRKETAAEEVEEEEQDEGKDREGNSSEKLQEE